MTDKKIPLPRFRKRYSASKPEIQETFQMDGSRAELNNLEIGPPVNATNERDVEQQRYFAPKVNSLIAPEILP